jgi:hypothetical protein
MDILAANALGRAFWDQVFDAPAHGNIARFNFLDSARPAPDRTTWLDHVTDQEYQG